MWEAKSGDDIRGMQPCAMLVAFVEAHAKLMRDHKLEADQCTAPVPPQVQKMLDVAVKNVEARRQNSKVVFEDSARRTAKVFQDLRSHPQLSHVCRFSDSGAALDCSCLFPKATGFPCLDVIQSAIEAGFHNLTLLLNDRDKTPFHKRLWATLPQDLYPGSMAVFTGPGSNLCLPPEIPKPAGRPVEHRIPNMLERHQGRGRGGGGRGSHSPARTDRGSVQAAPAPAPPAAPLPLAAAVGPPAPPVAPPQPAAAAGPPAPAPMGGAGGPMRRPRGPGICKRCGGSGHYQKSCKVGAGSLLH